ncbi:NUDIX hydrolase [Dyadobacter tibetensis]|uniref:NUDIX hydrolase n=1 Tax=Dyadobacter tibetensis TaxID=1211851 RepID=UPI00046F0EB8|nr:NUDIX domain-containing protein [Dyadobacter tibetensis]
MVKYPAALKVFVAIDCIIFGFDGRDLKLLLVKRNLEPQKGNWSLMGGFLYPDEDLDQGAGRIVKELTGLTNIYCEQLTVKGDKNRDPGARTVSVVYFALIKIEESDEELVRSHNASWIVLERRPDLIFDHNQMVLDAIDHLRYKAALHPIGFELLSETFTIPQLQKLYEAIYDVPIDRRNFSRKLLSTSLLIDTGMKNIHSTTKKATLYRLDKVRYNEKFHAFWNFMADSSKS